MPDYIDLGRIAPECNEERLDIQALCGHRIKSVELVDGFWVFSIEQRGSKFHLFKVSAFR